MFALNFSCFHVWLGDSLSEPICRLTTDLYDAGALRALLNVPEQWKRSERVRTQSRFMFYNICFIAFGIALAAPGVCLHRTDV